MPNKILKCNQNSCNSSEAVKPQFNVGLCFLIISASCYVGKTDRTLHERAKKHAYAKGNKNKQSAICEHLSLCTHYSHIADLFKTDTNSFNSNQFNVS